MSMIRICDICNRKIEKEGFYKISKNVMDDSIHDDVDVCDNCMGEIRRMVRKANEESDTE